MRLIDADAAAEKLIKEATENALGEGTENDIATIALMLKFARALKDDTYFQTIEAEPAQNGRWIPIEYDSYADGVPVFDKWECSECGHEHSGEEDTLSAFCAECGAKMEVSKDAADKTT